MTLNQQPEALRLAEILEEDALMSGLSRREHLDYRIDAATELRRLHERVEKLENALLEIQQVACSNSPELHISTKALA